MKKISRIKTLLLELDDVETKLSTPLDNSINIDDVGEPDEIHTINLDNELLQLDKILSILIKIAEKVSAEGLAGYSDRINRIVKELQIIKSELGEQLNG